MRTPKLAQIIWAQLASFSQILRTPLLGSEVYQTDSRSERSSGLRSAATRPSCAAQITSKCKRSSWSDLDHAAVDEELDASEVATFF
jgi:hypothetical protein